MFGFVFFACLATAVEVQLNQLNPVTRVAELLEELASKVTLDQKVEQEMYDKYKCWCKTNMEDKAANIEKNSIEIQELEDYIDDLSNGRVELTSERSDTEAEISDLEKAIYDATTMREKENADYLEAQGEMDKAITALDNALTTLRTATVDYLDGESLAAVKVDLKEAVQTGSGFLAKRDLASISKILDVPQVDWKKMNRDATFKQNYTARSTGIQDVLQDTYDTFVSNLDDAKTQENRSKYEYDLLMTTKKNQLQIAKQALLDKSTETAARNAAVSAANLTMMTLINENTQDRTFFTNTKTACNTKATEWDARKTLRTNEIAAITKAVGILRSDDARDQFSVSYSNAFIQEKVRTRSPTTKKVTNMLQRVALESCDKRIQPLIKLIQDSSAVAVGSEVANATEPHVVSVPDYLNNSWTGDRFGPVLSAIAGIRQTLLNEEAADINTKKNCEREQMQNTKAAKNTSASIDESVRKIADWNLTIAKNNKTIDELNAQMDALRQLKQDAEEQRKLDKRENAASIAEDEKAIVFIVAAQGTLEKFYADNNLVLISSKKSAGKFTPEWTTPAPEAAPTLWGTGETYGGAVGEKDGIIGIMHVIRSDIRADILEADKDERDGVAVFEALKTDIKNTISALQTRRGTLKGQVATDLGNIVTEQGSISMDQGDLDATLNLLATIKPGCDWMLEHFDARYSNRKAELYGLGQAASILSGANEFTMM